MTEQEQIEEIAIRIDPLCNEGDHCLKCYALQKYGCINFERAKELYKAGYRKASDVIDEFVERLKQDEESVKIGNEWKAVVRDVDIERIAAEMRQEVEE